MGRAVVSPAELGPLAEAELIRLCAQFPLPIPPRLEWRRYRTTAGTACLRTGTIALGLHVLTDAERLRATLIHEYAHLLAFHRAGTAGRGHGPAWRTAMRDLGVTPERTHRYPVARNQPRQEVVYRCAHCRTEIVRRRRLPRGKKYSHVGCGGSIRYVGHRPMPPLPPFIT